MAAEVGQEEVAEQEEELEKELELAETLRKLELQRVAEAPAEEGEDPSTGTGLAGGLLDGLQRAVDGSMAFVANGWLDEKMHIEVADTFEDRVQLVKSPAGTTHFACPVTLPHPRVWPERPLMLRESSVHSGWDPRSGALPVPTDGSPYPFETALFKGEIMLRLRSNPAAASYFEGKNRLSSVTISGKFKKALRFEDVKTGQEFCKPVKQPPTLVVKAAIKFFRLLAPLLQVFIGNQTYLLSPLAQTCQVIHVSDGPVELKPAMEVEENWAAVETGKPMTQLQRKKHFSNKKNLAQHSFSTEKYYTFDFYNDKLDMETFKLRALGRDFDVHKYLQGQPLRVLSRVFAPGDPAALYLWNFELWHERVTEFLPDLPATAATAARGSGGSDKASQ